MGGEKQNLKEALAVKIKSKKPLSEREAKFAVKLGLIKKRKKAKRKKTTKKIKKKTKKKAVKLKKIRKKTIKRKKKAKKRKKVTKKKKTTVKPQIKHTGITRLSPTEVKTFKALHGAVEDARREAERTDTELRKIPEPSRKERFRFGRRKLKKERSKATEAKNKAISASLAAESDLIDAMKRKHRAETGVPLIEEQAHSIMMNREQVETLHKALKEWKKAPQRGSKQRRKHAPISSRGRYPDYSLPLLHQKVNKLKVSVGEGSDWLVQFTTKEIHELNSLLEWTEEPERVWSGGDYDVTPWESRWSEREGQQIRGLGEKKKRLQQGLQHDYTMLLRQNPRLWQR